MVLTSVTSKGMDYGCRRHEEKDEGGTTKKHGEKYCPKKQIAQMLQCYNNHNSLISA